MKKLFILFALTVSCLAQAQQTSYLGFYYANPFVLNPATAGLNEQTQAFLHYRKQWVGIEGAPETQVATVDWRIPNQNMGLGVQLNRDFNNFFNRNSIKLSYAYHLSLNDKHKMHFGMAAGVVQNSLLFENIQANLTDPLLTGSTNSSTRFDADFGFQYVFNKRLEIGFVAQQLLGAGFKYEDAELQQSLTYRLVNHYNAIAGYRFTIKESRFDLKPMVLARSAQGLPLEFEAGLIGYYDDLLYAGVNYRNGVGFAGSFGLNLAKRYQIGYLYEYATSELGVQSIGSHEFILGIKFGGAAPVSNKEIKELQKQNAMLYEKVDMLNQEKEALKKHVDGLEKLKKDMRQNQEKVELLQQEKGVNPPLKTTPTGSQDAPTNSSTSNGGNGLIPIQGNAKATQPIDTKSSMRTGRIDVVVKDDVNIEDYELDERFTDAIYDFEVIVGSFSNIENAKQMQKILMRELGQETTVVQNDESGLYHVKTKTFEKQIDALKEVMTLKKADVKGIINGNPWIKAIEIQ